MRYMMPGTFTTMAPAWGGIPSAAENGSLWIRQEIKSWIRKTGIGKGAVNIFRTFHSNPLPVMPLCFQSRLSGVPTYRYWHPPSCPRYVP